MTKEEIFFSNLRKMGARQRMLNCAMEKGYSPDYQLSEVLIIDLIGQIPEANVTRLSEASFMTKGAVSKIIKKLISYTAVESYQKPGNKKEIYYKLTGLGEDIFKKHHQFNKTLMERDRIVFDELTEIEKDIVIRFFENFNRHLDHEILKTHLQDDSKETNK